MRTSEDEEKSIIPDEKFWTPPQYFGLSVWIAGRRRDLLMFFLLCLCTWNFEKEWEQAQTNVTLEAKFLLLLLLFIILRKVDVTFACVYVRTLCTVPLNEMLEASTVYKASSILACIFEFCNKFPLFPTL